MVETLVIKPYEILLRYCCEIGEAAGHLRGMSLQQKSFMVDETGTIKARLDRGNDDHPKEFPPEDLQKYLGNNFVIFEAQLTAARQARDAALVEVGNIRKESAAKLTEANNIITQLHSKVTQLQSQFRAAAKAEKDRNE